jgi:hypothetical protein
MRTKKEIEKKLEQCKQLLKTSDDWQYLFGYIDALEFALYQKSDYKKRYG